MACRRWCYSLPLKACTDVIPLFMSKESSRFVSTASDLLRDCIHSRSCTKVVSEKLTGNQFCGCIYRKAVRVSLSLSAVMLRTFNKQAAIDENKMFLRISTRKNFVQERNSASVFTQAMNYNSRLSLFLILASRNAPCRSTALGLFERVSRST